MHVLVLGSVGAGKTKILEAVMKTLLGTLTRFDARAIVLDAKREFIRFIDSLALGVRVVIFDPTDARCHAWNMAADIVDEDDAATLAEIFVERNEHASRPFFDDAARELLKEVVEALIRKKRLTLRNIVYTMRSEKRIRALIGTTEEGRDVIAQYLSKERTVQDVMSTIGTKIGRFKTVAKAWDHAEREGRTVSIDEWMRGHFIIILGSSNKAAATVRALNHLFFKRLSQVLLDEPDNDQADLLSPRSRRHYLFLDEIRLAGKLDGLNDLFLKGRSKGVVLGVGVQDRKGMLEVYGENVADEQLSQAATIGILRLQSPDTATWASKLIGQYETVQLSHSSGADGKGSDTASVSVKDAVLPSEILRLPLAGPKNGLHGYFLSPTVGVWKAAVPWDEVMAARAPARESLLENYVRRVSDPNEPLRAWTETELEELGISRADLEGEKEVEGADEPQPTAEEEKALEDLARMRYEEELGM
jgi:type IV secretory pathway TraG/TraD family ATPase VirD4